MSTEHPSPLFQSLERITARDPGKIAVVEGNARSTYRQILDRIGTLSTTLVQQGIKPGEYVAVILPNSSDFVVAAFAIWRCGAVLVPLHVRFQEDEIIRYVTDCSVRAIISHSRFGALVQTIQTRQPGVEHAWLFPAGSGDCQYVGHGPASVANTSVPQVEADWPALSQYSTGSTGFSKRITRTHRQLVEEFDTVSKHLQISSADRILGVAPFFHSYGLSNVVLSSLLSGATLYAVSDFFPKDVIKLIETERLTGFPGVPFMYQLLADQRGGGDLSSLRYALAAGAPLPAVTTQNFFSLYQVGIRQLYGSTETGVISIEPAAATAGQDPTVGFPIPGVTVRITDESAQAVPAGTEGQVAVISRYAASRYENLSTKSESYFSEGVFYPGDLGRMEADDRLILSGRKRQFINVAGNKVDPTEIENVLREFPAITEVVVLGVPDGAASEKIKAVIVAREGCTRTDVIAHCKRLAEFKRPRVIEFRQEIPKSPLGKILRKYLIE